MNPSYRNWREVVELALDETRYAYQNQEIAPGCEEFVGTFCSFYDELIYETRVTMWPIDPPSSRRMAESRATEIWADDYSDSRKERKGGL